MNKSVLTNVIAAGIALLGYLLPDATVILMTGLFALSGGITATEMAEPAAAVVTSWYDAGMRLVDEAAEEEVALKGVVVPMEAVKEEKTVDAGGRPVPTADDTLEIAKDMAKEEYKA